MLFWLVHYLDRSRKPWACALFVVPLLIAYESGLRFLNPNPESLRTGVDAWIHSAAAWAGIRWPLVPPIVLSLTLIAWAWLAGDRLEEPLAVWTGMAVESACFAGLLFGLVQLVFPILSHAGGLVQDVLNRVLDVSSETHTESTWSMIVRFLGAGIYEETLFRLFGLTLIRWVLLAGDVRERWANIAAAILSSILFAAAHHLGSGHEHVNATVFLYRTFAGLYFAALFETRGYGIAVGAHVGFDMLVGLMLR